MNEYENALRKMETLFGRDEQFALATTGEDGPSNRFVDTYFTDGSFYIVTYALSRKVKETAADPRAALCSAKLHAFSGKVDNIGHPLKPENAEIRDKLIQAFAPWYFRHNNEDDPHMCYLRFTPESGFFQADGTGWRVDFKAHTAETFPFAFDITPSEA